MNKFLNRIRRSFDPSEREFNQIWPAVNRVEGHLVSPFQERWLFETAKRLPEPANIVEIGSFQGRSTCCLAYGCRGMDKHVFAIDTFDGNEVDFTERGFFDKFCQNIASNQLSNYVTPIRGHSVEVAKTWARPIHMLFIDGSHQYEDVVADFFGFFPHIVAGGIVAVHDVVETWPGPLKAWNDRIKTQLRNTGNCKTLGYGVKPDS